MSKADTFFAEKSFEREKEKKHFAKGFGNMM